MPSLSIEDNAFPVSEISEGGLRFQSLDAHDQWEIDDEISGVITFHNKEEIAISGKVLRKESKEIVIAPLEGVDFKRIVAEQRIVRDKFPFYRFGDS